MQAGGREFAMWRRLLSCIQDEVCCSPRDYLGAQIAVFASSSRQEHRNKVMVNW
jgi:hypothetical protein